MWCWLVQRLLRTQSGFQRCSSGLYWWRWTPVLHLHLCQDYRLVLSRVGVTWYTFKQKAPKFRVDWYKGAYFCKIVEFFGHYNRLKRQTLNGRLPPEDSSVFDDSVCVLIVMTWSIVWAKVGFFSIFFVRRRRSRRHRRRRQLLSLLIQSKRKSKRRRKQKRKRGNLRGGAMRPPRRSLHPLRFCFRLRFNLRLLWINNESNWYQSSQNFGPNYLRKIPCNSRSRQ